MLTVRVELSGAQCMGSRRRKAITDTPNLVFRGISHLSTVPLFVPTISSEKHPVTTYLSGITLPLESPSTVSVYELYLSDCTEITCHWPISALSLNRTCRANDLGGRKQVL
jgi:hypothetical protein